MPLTNFWVTKKRYYFFIVCMIALLGTACSGPTPREKQQAQLLAKLDSSLERTLVFMNEQTTLSYHALEDRLQDPVAGEKAKRWYPIAKKIREHCKVLMNYTEHINKLLEKRKANDVFTKDAWGDSLYKALSFFKKTTLNADERLMAQFEYSVMSNIDIDITTLNKKAKHFTQQNFAYLNNGEARAALRYWQKEILATEHKFIAYCFNNTYIGFCSPEFERALVTQSHAVLSPGEILTITAGIGNYSFKSQPKVNIDGRAIPITEGAIAIHTFKVVQKKGHYTIPVFMEFLNVNGEKATRKIDVNYTVQ